MLAVGSTTASDTTVSDTTMHVARGVQRRVVNIPHRDVHSGDINNFVLQPRL
eukprot:COSAG01_NODE_54776_length_329_cov_14.900000_1_plen_51_part_10